MGRGGGDCAGLKLVFAAIVRDGGVLARVVRANGGGVRASRVRVQLVLASRSVSEVRGLLRNLERSSSFSGPLLHPCILVKGDDNVRFSQKI